MFRDLLSKHPVLAFGLLSGLAFGGCVVSSQSITVGKGSSRSISANFFGVNGAPRNSIPWDQTNSSGQYDNPGFPPALNSLQSGFLRFPGGQIANWWDWNAGDYVTGYKSAYTTPSPYPSPLSELQAELASASKSTGVTTQPIFVLNALTDPLCTSNCSYTTNSPDESYQLQLLAQAAADHIQLPYLEIGNEYYLSGTSTVAADYGAVYPTGANYAEMANQWISDIKRTSPSAKIAVVASNATSSSCPSCPTRQADWNQDMFDGAYPLAGADAVVIHEYLPSGLSSGTTVDNNSAETMLLQPFLWWDTFSQAVIPSLQNTSGTYQPSIWFTEYDLNDKGTGVASFDTWAHGLFLATQDLWWGLQNNRVQNMDSFTTQDTVAVHPEIFASTSALCAPPSSPYTYPADGCSITTAVNGLSAAGLIQQTIFGAALGQTSAQELTFSNGPTFDGTHPQLLGWVFSGGTNTKAIILNLDNVAETVDMSNALSGGSFSQIYGDAGTFVTGTTVSGGFQAFLDTSNGLVEDDLRTNSGAINPSSFTLPPFSITSVSVGTFTVAVSPASQSGNAGTNIQFSVTVSAVDGFAGTVDLSDVQQVVAGKNISLKNWPYSISPSSVTLTSTQPTGTATLTQTISQYAASGSEISDTLTGTSGPLSYTAPAVTVSATN